MKQIYLITLIFMSSCANKMIECEQDIAKYSHSCPEAGHGACPFCEEIVYFEKNLLTNIK